MFIYVSVPHPSSENIKLLSRIQRKRNYKKTELTGISSFLFIWKSPTLKRSKFWTCHIFLLLWREIYHFDYYLSPPETFFSSGLSSEIINVEFVFLIWPHSSLPLILSRVWVLDFKNKEGYLKISSPVTSCFTWGNLGLSVQITSPKLLRHLVTTPKPYSTQPQSHISCFSAYPMLIFQFFTFSIYSVYFFWTLVCMNGCYHKSWILIELIEALWEIQI